MKKKKENNSIEIIVFIICVILIAGFFLVMIGINGREKYKKNEEINKEDEQMEHVDLNFAQEVLDRITYPIVLHTGDDSFNAMAYYYSKNILVENMTMESKVLIAVLNTEGECTDKECILNEEDVKVIYNELFGDKVKYTFPKSKYLRLKNGSIILNKEWKTNSNGFVFTKIKDATMNDKELKIYVKVAFQYDSTLFYDYNLTNIIEEVSTCTSNDDLDYYDNLYEYIYTFKIIDGNYTFYSVKRK